MKEITGGIPAGGTGKEIGLGMEGPAIRRIGGEGR